MDMSMYNLLECSQNYSMTGSLWNFYRQIDDVANASYGKSSNYKTKLSRKTPEKPAQPDPDQDGNPQPRPLVPAFNAEVTIPLKHLSNFCRFLDLLLLKCEIGLGLSRVEDCALSERHNIITGATFQINNAKRYVLIVTLSINDYIKLLENIKQVFERTLSWGRYRSKITTQTKQ